MTLTILATDLPDADPAACFAPEELADAASRVQLLLRQHEVNQGLRADVERLTNELTRVRAELADANGRVAITDNRVRAIFNYLHDAWIVPRVKAELVALLTGRA